MPYSTNLLHSENWEQGKRFLYEHNLGSDAGYLDKAGWILRSGIAHLSDARAINKEDDPGPHVLDWIACRVLEIVMKINTQLEVIIYSSQIFYSLRAIPYVKPFVTDIKIYPRMTNVIII